MSAEALTNPVAETEDSRRWHVASQFTPLCHETTPVATAANPVSAG